MTATRTVAAASTVAGAGYSSQGYSYDQAGRLTQVQDTYAGTCTTRVYTLDAHANRSSLVSHPASSGTTCSSSTTPTASLSYSYDQADRLTTTRELQLRRSRADRHRPGRATPRASPGTPPPPAP